LFHNRSSTDQAGGNATTANATGTKRKITTTESATVKASNGPRTKTTTKGNPTTATRTMSTTDVTTTSAMAPAYRATKAKANTTTAVGKTTETAATTIRANRKTTKAKATKTGSAISLSAFEGSEKSSEFSIVCDVFWLHCFVSNSSLVSFKFKSGISFSHCIILQIHL